MSIAYALLSLLCAGMVDIVFKHFSMQIRSRGTYIAGIGVVWTFLQFTILTDQIRMDGQTIAFGLLAGLLVSFANLALIESLQHMDVSTASTIYRLNSVVVVVLAIVLLGEDLTIVKTTGVLLGVAGVIALYKRESLPDTSHKIMSIFWLVVVAGLLRASFGIVSKAAVSRGIDPMMMLLVNGPVWILAGVSYAMLREMGLCVTRDVLSYSLISGTLICAIANFLLLALQSGDASIIVPIANMSFLVTLIISISLGMEKITRSKIAAIVLALASILVLSQS